MKNADPTLSSGAIRPEPERPPIVLDGTRRLALQRLCALMAAPAAPLLLASCGGGGGDADSEPAPVAPAPPAPAAPPLPAPVPSARTPLGRLKIAIGQPALSVSADPVSVSQGAANSASPALGTSAVVIPPLTNPSGQTLATAPQVWGFKRNLWTAQAGAVIGSVVYPMSRNHPAATTGSNGVCALHVVFDGRAFEILFAGSNTRVTLVADGRYMAPQVIQTTLDRGVPGALLSAPNTFVRFDFGTATSRQISIYAVSSQGPCAIAVAATDRIEPWDRSTEASIASMADSYGGAPSPNWGVSGPFWEAAALLGIPHVDLDAIGGSGYAANNTNVETRNPGNAFRARLPTSVDAKPDLFITAGGINDNNSIAAPPLYATVAEAFAAFNAGVASYFADLRTALPDAVLAAVGPWAPREVVGGDPVALSKADAIKGALQAAGGAWIFIDNLRGGWSNSAGASAAGFGPWQTGTGNSGTPRGDGNGDLYLAAEGVHPNAAGSLYLGTRLATDLRAAIMAL